MTERDHARIIGILFLAFGGLAVIGVVGALIFLLGMGGFAMFNSNAGDAMPLGIMFGIFTVTVLAALIFIIPSLIAGWQLIKGNGKGKLMTVISAIIYVLQFPIGTIIGVYALWFIFGDHGKRYFRS